MPLTPNDLEILALELQRPDLRVYSVVKMAERDLAEGNVAGALSRLRIDADKLRTHETAINRLLRGSENK